jgi:hypothetical protein
MKKLCPQCSHLRKNKREKRFQERFERESGRLAARAFTMDQWRDYAYRLPISAGKDRAKQKAFKDASERLIDLGYVGRWDDQVWLAKE